MRLGLLFTHPRCFFFHAFASMSSLRKRYCVAESAFLISACVCFPNRPDMPDLLERRVLTVDATFASSAASFSAAAAANCSSRCSWALSFACRMRLGGWVVKLARRIYEFELASNE